MKNPIKQVCNLSLALVVLGSMAMAHIAAAATLDFYVNLPQYGYVVIKPGSNTGGALRWDGVGYYTDRVNRGERLYILEQPVAGENTGPYSAVFDVLCVSLNQLLVDRWAPWYGSYWYEEYVVPTDPNKDNLYIIFKTNVPTPPKRIPIGYRNP